VSNHVSNIWRRCFQKGAGVGIMKSLYFLWMVCFCQFCASLALASDNEEVGKVVSSTGRSIARIEGRDLGKKGIPQSRTLKPGEKIYQFDVINTGSESAVKILFNDQSIIDLGASTLFKVEEYRNRGKPEDRKVQLNLAYGRIRAAINQKVGKEGKFKLKTHAATMGVRGTEFYVNTGSVELSPSGGNPKLENNAAVTELVVTEGEVEAIKVGPLEKHSKPYSVSPGEKLTVITDFPKEKGQGAEEIKAPVLEKITSTELQSVVSATKVVDQTFSQSIKIDGLPKSDTSPGAENLGAQGAETLAAIKDAILNQPELRDPGASSAQLSAPGLPAMQPNYNGNFLPGFNTRFVTLRIRIRP